MTIRDWLNSERNYNVGVAFYKSYGVDTLLKQMFDQGFSAFRAERLLQELRLLKGLDEGYVPVQAAAPDHLPVVVSGFSMPEDNTAPAKDPYRKEWLPIYQEMNLLRHSLETIATDLERGQIAHQVLDLEQQCMAVWAKRDYFLKYGREPEHEQAEDDPLTDMNQAMRRLSNVRSTISKRKKDPVPDKEKLQQLEEERDRLQEYLKNARL